MKKMIFVLAAITLFASCAGAPRPVAEDATDFSEVVGREWILIEVRIDGETTPFNREALIQDGFGEAFTLNFDAETIYGAGAPNRYTAPFTREDETLNVMMVRSTLMAAIFEPEHLREHDFFTYIQNINSWMLMNGTLFLVSETADGNEVTLIFN